jgi:hypothetical protein
MPGTGKVRYGLFHRRAVSYIDDQSRGRPSHSFDLADNGQGIIA